MRKTIAVLAVVCVSGAQVPGFEVVSIKPAAPDQGLTMSRGGPGTRTPGSWICRNMSLHNVIAIAYDTWIDGQLVAPGWTQDLRFDIDAKVPAGAPKDTLLPMLRQMLADRFALKVHTEPKEVQGYKLVVAKNGPNSPWRNPRNFRGDSSRIADADRLRCDRLTFVGRAEGCH